MNLHAHEILDSRGNPTVEAELILPTSSTGKDSKNKFKASVPSGASTGIHEALELRDKDKKRYLGKGVLKACKNVTKIYPKIKNLEITSQKEIDKTIISLAGKNKNKLGANATLATSLVCARVGANLKNQELYKYINKIFQIPNSKFQIPVPMFNIINGGAHADNNLPIQEFMVVPIGIKKFSQQLRASSEIFHALGKILKQNHLSTAVGNEGGYAPDFESILQVFDYLISAIKSAGYKPKKEIMIALDIGASELYNKKKKKYILALENLALTSNELINFYINLSKKYPIISIEDGLAEDDWKGWEKMLIHFKHHNILSVGDDLLTTNVVRLEKSIQNNSADAVIVKPNQIGTLTETINFVKLAQKNNYKIITSHRSGETCDDFIADLSVAINSDFVKFGAPSRGERVAKYNRLLEIEREIK